MAEKSNTPLPLAPSAPPPAPSALVPPPPAPTGKKNPAIKAPKAAPVEPSAPPPVVDDGVRNKDGFIAGAEVSWDQLMAHKNKGGDIGDQKS